MQALYISLRLAFATSFTTFLLLALNVLALYAAENQTVHSSFASQTHPVRAQKSYLNEFLAV